MTEKQKEFLKLAVVGQKTYEQIEVELGIPRKVFSLWWDELKDERENLSKIRKVWRLKFNETDFWKFKNWYEKTKRECYYCGITENQISELFEKGKLYTKRKRGRKLEIDRKEPDEAYDNIENLVFSCY